MGARRQLMQEIEKTLKKVAEGIDTFNSIWEKVQAAEGNQKEKFEADLKKEIKKLQRHRDSIKTWIGSNEIKDKNLLIQARKDIERKMELFKVCEKETKTKAFSKEGLGQAAKLDPRETARLNMVEWIHSAQERMTEEIEALEADLDGLQMVKKKSKAQSQQALRIEEQISRHRRHVERLEQMHRLLDNELFTADDLDETKMMVEDYMDRSSECFEDFTNPDDVYGELLTHLQALDVNIPTPAVVHIGKVKDGAKDKDKERERQVEKERAAALAAKQQLAAQGAINVKLDEDSTLSPEKALGRKGDKGRGAGLPPLAPLTRVETATPSETASNAPSAPSTPGHVPAHAFQQAAGAGPSTPPVLQMLDEQGSGSLPSSLRTAGSSTVPEAFPQLGRGPPAAEVKRAADVVAGRPGLPNGTQQAPGPKPGAYPAGTYASHIAASAQPVKDGRRLTPSAQGGVDTAESALTAEPIQDLQSALAIQEGGLLPESPHPIHTAATATALATCYQRSIPQPVDQTWNPLPTRQAAIKGGFPPSYPTTRLPVLDSPQLYEKQDPEALFFAFYYQPGTYQQLLAAKELKRQSWRYHKHHNAWFQRHEEPKLSTTDYEQGTYVYFDYNIVHDDEQHGWCYRLKTDFTFKYDAMENELQA